MAVWATTNASAGSPSDPFTSQAVLVKRPRSGRSSAIASTIQPALLGPFAVRQQVRPGDQTDCPDAAREQIECGDEADRRHDLRERQGAEQRQAGDQKQLASERRPPQRQAGRRAGSRAGPARPAPTTLVIRLGTASVAVAAAAPPRPGRRNRRACPGSSRRVAGRATAGAPRPCR